MQTGWCEIVGEFGVMNDFWLTHQGCIEMLKEEHVPGLGDGIVSAETVNVFKTRLDHHLRNVRGYL